MSVFPLDILVKEDTPERLAALADVPAKHVIYATDFNLLVAALNELNARDVFIKSGKAVYLQAPANIAEQEPAIGDWAISVNAAGNLLIAQFNGNNGQGQPTFINEREYEKA